MLIKIGDFEFTEVWDGVLYKKLSQYPTISDWEKRNIIEFVEYEASHACLEELEPFAGISVPDIPILEANRIQFRLLTLEQYLKVYTASAKDGYRMNVKEKKDQEKIDLIRSHLGDCK